MSCFVTKTFLVSFHNWPQIHSANFFRTWHWIKMGRCSPRAVPTCPSSYGTSRRTSASRRCMATTTTWAACPSSPPVITSWAAAGTRPSRCGRSRPDSACEPTRVTGEHDWPMAVTNERRGHMSQRESPVSRYRPHHDTVIYFIGPESPCAVPHIAMSAPKKNINVWE